MYMKSYRFIGLFAFVLVFGWSTDGIAKQTGRAKLSTKQLLRRLRSARRSFLLARREHYCALKRLGVRLVKELPALLKQIKEVAITEDVAGGGFPPQYTSVQAGINAICLLKSLEKKAHKALPTLRNAKKKMAWLPKAAKTGRLAAYMRPRALLSLPMGYPTFWKMLKQLEHELSGKPNKKKRQPPPRIKKNKRTFGSMSMLFMNGIDGFMLCQCPK
tara:strand:- start:1170 stop:1820 length:651 start_codon:yes stop_codon:yes gene_type:complete